VVDGEQLAVLGDGGYALGARAGQIRDALRAGNRMTERDMLAIQLDDRAVFLARWQSMLLGILDDTAVAADPLRAAARSHIEAWGGRAATDSVGYRLVREFRRTLSDEILAGLTEPVTAADPEFRTWRLGQSEAAVWRLLNERPPGLLPAGAVSWRELMLRVLDSTVDNLVQQYGSLDRATWGGRNTVWIRHPLSRALPALSRWLDMPAVELPGDAYMPRVQSPTFGASERMVVSPGREELGIFHMPCGQSGHPLSPFYRAGHEAWVRGEPTPFLPGRAVHELRLAPSAGGSDRSESRTLSP
jgi:penicillin amidase